MLQVGPRPSFSKPQAHHDFPWKHVEWFAQHGIDVNNPAFGRWVTEREHILWEKQLPITYEKYWDLVREEETARGILFTIQELLDKLAQARAQFPVLSGQ
jgi:hypothetical protein